MNIEIEFNKEKEIAEKFYKALEFKCLKRITDDFLADYNTLENIQDYLKNRKEQKWGVYIIYVEKTINYSLIKTAYDTAKKKYSMSRAPENEEEEKFCLYVGSSKDVYKRLKKHIGWGKSYKKEYALHMDQWLPDENRIKIDLYDMDPEILETIGPSLEFMSNELKMQLIEDIFWSVQKPLFGKKGGK